MDSRKGAEIIVHAAGDGFLSDVQFLREGVLVAGAKGKFGGTGEEFGLFDATEVDAYWVLQATLYSRR